MSATDKAMYESIEVWSTFFSLFVVMDDNAVQGVVSVDERARGVFFFATAFDFQPCNDHVGTRIPDRLAFKTRSLFDSCTR